MTVQSVTGKWVVGTWWSEAYGGFQTAGFPRATVDGPITLPPIDVTPRTPQISPTEPSDRPPGDSSSAGQPNQNPTAQSTNPTPTRQVRPANAGTSMSISTRPARILPLQQGTGPLHQGAGTNPRIGVPRARPALALPQGTVQTAIPLQQRAGINQSVGQVRPANASTSMRPQGVIGK